MLKRIIMSILPPLDYFKSNAKLDAKSKERLRHGAIQFAKKCGCHKDIRFDDQNK